MKKQPQNYALTSEIANAVLMGVGCFAIICLLFWLVHVLATVDIFAIIWASFRDESLSTVVGRAIFFLLFSVAGLGAWFVIILMIALLQSALIAVPIAKVISKGVERDANRSWAFYILIGAIIGSGPWCILAFSMFDKLPDTGSALVLFLPGFGAGIFAGAILKHRLNKLATATGIENSIK